MKKLIPVILALLLFVTAITPAFALDKKGDVISEMELTDTEGNSVLLSDFFGKPIVINFWATWCPWCIYEFPAYEKLYEEYGDRIQFMMVDLCDGQYETAEKALAFIEENGFTFPVYFDANDYSYFNFGYTGIPASVFVGADGVIVWADMGAMEEDSLRALMESILPAE